MIAKSIPAYTQPHQFEPLLPQTGLEDLRRRGRAVAEQSLRLGASAHPDTIASLRELLRAMNSYYSNRIGLRKPSVEIYEWVIAQNQLNPQETIFIDDLEANVMGAKQAGLHVYHLDKTQTDLEKLFKV